MRQERLSVATSSVLPSRTLSDLGPHLSVLAVNNAVELALNTYKSLIRSVNIG